MNPIPCTLPHYSIIPDYVLFSREPRYDHYGFPYVNRSQLVDEDDLEAKADTLLRKSDELSTQVKVTLSYCDISQTFSNTIIEF